MSLTSQARRNPGWPPTENKSRRRRKSFKSFTSYTCFETFPLTGRRHISKPWPFCWSEAPDNTCKMQLAICTCWYTLCIRDCHVRCPYTYLKYMCIYIYSFTNPIVVTCVNMGGVRIGHQDRSPGHPNRELRIGHRISRIGHRISRIGHQDRTPRIGHQADQDMLGYSNDTKPTRIGHQADQDMLGYSNADQERLGYTIARRSAMLVRRKLQVHLSGILCGISSDILSGISSD